MGDGFIDSSCIEKNNCNNSLIFKQCDRFSLFYMRYENLIMMISNVF